MNFELTLQFKFQYIFFMRTAPSTPSTLLWVKILELAEVANTDDSLISSEHLTRQRGRQCNGFTARWRTKTFYLIIFHTTARDELPRLNKAWEASKSFFQTQFKTRRCPPSGREKGGRVESLSLFVTSPHDLRPHWGPSCLKTIATRWSSCDQQQGIEVKCWAS